MRILSISLDQRVVDPKSTVYQRQAAYFVGHEVRFIVLENKSRSKISLFLSALREAWSTKNIDLVTAQDPFFCGLVGYIAAKRAKAALQIQDHSGAFARKPFGWKELLLRPISKFISRRADRVRTVSQRGKRGMQSIGIKENGIDVIPILGDVGIFLSIERKLLPSQNVLSVGRLEKEKGMEVLLFAFAMVKKTVPNAKLMIVGDGSMRSSLEGLCDRLDLHSSVEFKGKIELPVDAFAAADVYVQPSYFEGWGMAAVEASASGLPVVMTNVGCADEVILDQKNGLIVPPGDAKAMSLEIIKLLQQSELANRMGKQGREIVKGFMLQHPDPVKEVRQSFERTVASRHNAG